MKINKFILSLLMTFVLSSFIVFGLTLTYSTLNPSAGSTETSRTVTHSVKFSMTDTDLTSMNVTLYLNDTAVSTTHELNNNTLYSVLYNSTNGDYEWYFNYTNSTNNVYLDKSTTRYYTVAEVVPDLSVELLSPSKYYTSTSTTINFTWNVTATGGFIGGDEPIQCALYNRSSSTGVYSITNYTNVTNSTSEISFSMTKGENRVWWYVNCSTTYHPVIKNQVSEVRIFDVDIDYNMLALGTNEYIKFNLDTGEIESKVGYNITNSGGFFGNSSCTWIESPNGLTIVSACD